MLWTSKRRQINNDLSDTIQEIAEQQHDGRVRSVGESHLQEDLTLHLRRLQLSAGKPDLHDGRAVDERRKDPAFNGSSEL